MPQQVSPARSRGRTQVNDHKYATPTVREIPRPAHPDAAPPKTTRSGR
jgi:hypothetical protein